jgi:tetratricopeptide (TPR) repeat protein
MHRWIWPTAAVIVCFVAIGLPRWKFYQAGASARIEEGKEVLLLPPGKVLGALDLGYHSLAADLLFIRANIYYGRHILTDERLPWLNDFTDTLISLDPDFKKAYLWGAMVSMYRKRDSDRIESRYVRRAIAILKKGMLRFPNDYRFPMRIGFNYYYEMSDIEHGIPFFERASKMPGAPAWLREKLVDLYSKRGRRALARQMLAELAMEAEDPVLGKALADRLEALYTEPEKKELTVLRRRLVDEWRKDYSYAPFDLFLLVREP